MSYSRVKRHALKKQTPKKVVFSLLFTGLTIGLTSQTVNTESYISTSGDEKVFENFGIDTLETSVPLTIEATIAISTEANDIALATTKLLTSVNDVQETSVSSYASQNTNVSSNTQAAYESASYTTASQVVGTVEASTPQPSTSVSFSGALANGNTAGAIGSEAAAQMAAATGVPQSTWEYIIARESNGNPNVANASGASGLFQTMPGWGSTATVQDQINSALNAYNSQGLSAWGMQ